MYGTKLDAQSAPAGDLPWMANINNNPNNMRSANRNRNSTDNRNNNNGFRLVQSAHEARVESFRDGSSVHWVSMSLFPALARKLWQIVVPWMAFGGVSSDSESPADLVS